MNTGTFDSGLRGLARYSKIFVVMIEQHFVFMSQNSIVLLSYFLFLGPLSSRKMLLKKSNCSGNDYQYASFSLRLLCKLKINYLYIYFYIYLSSCAVNPYDTPR